MHGGGTRYVVSNPRYPSTIRYKEENNYLEYSLPISCNSVWINGSSQSLLSSYMDNRGIINISHGTSRCMASPIAANFYGKWCTPCIFDSIFLFFYWDLIYTTGTTAGSRFHTSWQHGSWDKMWHSYEMWGVDQVKKSWLSSGRSAVMHRILYMYCSIRSAPYGVDHSYFHEFKLLSLMLKLQLACQDRKSVV